jgi:hypothetical protein
MNSNSLLGYLSHQAIAPMVKKGLFSGHYIFLFEYLSSLYSLYAIGSVLGYTYRENFTIFLQLMSEEGRQGDLVKVMGKPAEERLAALKREPQNIYDLLVSEGPTLMTDLHTPGIIKYSNWEDFPKVSKFKLRPDYAVFRSQMLAAEAIGFGFQYPEITERLLSYEYDPEEWNKWYKAGLNIDPEPPKRIPLATLQAEAKALITPFVESVRPDLLAPLALQRLQ